MIETIDWIHPHDIVQAATSTRYAIPFFLSLVQMSFSGPVEHYAGQCCDLTDLCITHPEATYFVRAMGESMIGDHIQPGSVLVADSALKPVEGSVVVVWLNGDHCVKRYVPKGQMVMLESSNEHYMPIYVHPEQDDFKIIGVVTFIISRPPTCVRPCQC